MRIEFVGLATEIPDGWIDDSTLTFSIPDPDGLAMPRVGGASPRSCGNVAIQWDRNATGNARAFLDARLKELGQLLPGFAVEHRSEMGEAEELIAVAQCAFDPGTPVRQTYAVRRRGALMLVVTGTTWPGVHARYHDTFIDIARRMS
jgi:hypothetical protein